MQLAITVLGKKPAPFLNEVLTAVQHCHCGVLELRTTRLTQVAGACLLVEGNWNHIAKLEAALDTLKIRLDLQINACRHETVKSIREAVPYTLETISLDQRDVLFEMTAFLNDRHVGIEEIHASYYQTGYVDNKVFFTRFVLLLPADVRILMFREELLDFCDSLNLDAIFEPIKR